MIFVSRSRDLCSIYTKLKNVGPEHIKINSYTYAYESLNALRLSAGDGTRIGNNRNNPTEGLRLDYQL